MPRDSKPWFRKDRDAWFVTIHGRRFNLGPDKEAAFNRFYELMLHGDDEQPNQDDISVFQLFDEFLEWTSNQRAPRTYEWYKDFLGKFSQHLKSDRPADRLKPYDVLRWIAKHTTWSNTSQNSGIRAVQRAYRWGHRMGLIPSNPMQFIEKPRCGRREEIITPAQYADLLTNIRSKHFKRLIMVAWETGARPQELIRLEIRHVDLDNNRWVFPPKESKVKTRHRIIYLNEEALNLTREAIGKRKEGPVFRNQLHHAWHQHAIGCQFTRLKERINRRICLYMFRHSFATRMLTAGVDPMTVATLLGHADASMLGKVYQHLSQCPDHLLAKLNQVTIPAASA
jgi:integrase